LTFLYALGRNAPLHNQRFLAGSWRQVAKKLAKQWACVFKARTGGHARADFATKEQARQFAERHARAFSPTGAPLTWEDMDDSIVLSTQIGDYLVTHVTQVTA
jgi:hypothetical protein